MQIYNYPIIEIKEYKLKKQYMLQRGSRVIIFKQDTNKYIYETDIYFDENIKNQNLNLYINTFTSTSFLKRLNYSSEIIHQL